MDDAFRLVASQMPRTRRLTRFEVRAIAVSVVAAVVVASFAAFVVHQQRAADARRAQAIARQQAADAADAQQSATAEDALAQDTAAAGATVEGLLDREARDAATAALVTATRLADARGPEAVTAAVLSAADPDVVYVDGPSTAPSVVSIYAGRAGWAAAVHGGGDTCLWVAFSAPGRERYGTGTMCTGVAALAADSPSW
jgi:hypothetical protein